MWPLWPQTYYVAKDNLELLNPLSLSTNYRSAAPCRIQELLRNEHRAWCMGGKCSARLLTSPGALFATVTESLRKSATIWMY